MSHKSKLAVLFLLLAPAPAHAAELKADTLQAWDAYICAAETRMAERARGHAPFLWVDEAPNLAQRLRAGEVIVEPEDGYSPRMVPRGLIHDWVGAVFVPNVQLGQVMDVLGDYEHYYDFYRPMVVKASLHERTRDHQMLSLLLVMKAFSLTGAVESDNELQIVRLGGDRAYSLSTSVRVHEIADYGKPSEHALPADHGPGYVWRTFSINRLEQRDQGVYIEMEMIAMSRGIPVLLRWLVQPLAERLPRNSLMETLTDTRYAVSQETQTASSKTRIMAHVAVPR